MSTHITLFALRSTTLSRLAFALVAAVLTIGAGTAWADDARQQAAANFVTANIKPWIGNPTIVDAVKAQNVETAKLKQAQVDQQDIDWLNRTDKTLIDSKMNNPLSTFLTAKKAALGPAVLEIFVFDGKKGLNVGETDLTEDYIQGDEAKYWKTYGEGPDAMFVDKVGPDGGKPNICQVSLTIKDPATGKAIGAMTVGIDTDQLK
jgi:hypothetical protein